MRRWARILLWILMALVTVAFMLLAYGNKVLIDRLERTRYFEYPSENRP